MKAAQSTIIAGPQEATNAACYAFIQKIVCTKKSCLQCVDCTMVQEQRHHHLLWLQPEKKYTLDSLEPIFSKIGFALQDDEHFFFIISKADLLTQACANSLLKIVEEPTDGYHFIFLTTQAQNIISTIRSRSHIIYTQQNQTTPLTAFLRHFTEAPSLPTTFLKDLQTTHIEDHAIPEAIDQLLSYWITSYNKTLLTDKEEAQKAHAMILMLQKCAEYPAMPGSSKIFWRNLYLAKDTLKKE